MDFGKRLDLGDCSAVVPGLRLFGYYRYRRAGQPLEYHNHGNCMEICFLARGAQRYDVGDREYRLKGGDIFIAFPGEEHSSHGHPQERGTLFWMGLQIKRPPQYFLNLRPPDARELLLELRSLPRRLFPAVQGTRHCLEQLMVCLCNEGLLKRQRASALLLNYVLGVIEAAHASAAREPSNTMQDVLEFIADHITEVLRIEELAAVAHLSVSQFKARFRRELGTAPYEYVLRQKIDAARDDLMNSDVAVTDVAFRYGFPSSQHFATMFKRFTGKRPSDVR